MTEKLELVKAYDFLADGGTVSMLSYTDGFNVAYEGWVPSGKASRSGFVDEVITVRARGTAIDNLASKVQGFENYLNDLEEFANSDAQNYGIWFRVQLAGETGVRQSLVHDLQSEMASSIFDYALRNRYHLNKFKIGIERYPWWEGTTAATISVGSVSVYGGTFAYTNLAGNMHARMGKLTVEPDFTPGGAAINPDDRSPYLFPYGQFWIGFRSGRFGTAADWVSSYPAYDGGNSYMQSVTTVADATSKSGTIVYGDFSSVGLNVRKLLQVVPIRSITSSHPEKMYGRFLVLARAKIGGSLAPNVENQFNLQLATAYLPEIDTDSGAYVNNPVFYPRVPVPRYCHDTDGTAYYHMFELGEVSLPTIRNAPHLDKDLALVLYGEETIDGGGSVQLYLDYLYFVPTAEGYYWGGKPLDVYSNTENQDYVSYFGHNHPDETVDAVAMDISTEGSIYPRAHAIEAPRYFRGIPPGSGIGVLVADSFAGTICDPDHIALADRAAFINTYKANIDIWAFPRYRSLRGTA